MADDLLPLDVVKFANDDPPDWTGLIDRIEGGDAVVIPTRMLGARLPSPGEVGAGEIRIPLDQLRRVRTLRTGRSGTDPAEEALGRQVLADWRNRTGEVVDADLFEYLSNKRGERDPRSTAGSEALAEVADRLDADTDACGHGAPRCGTSAPALG